MQLLCLQILCLQLHCSLLLFRHVMKCSTFCPCSAAKASRRSVAVIPRRPLPLLICCAAFTAAAAISVLEISRCSGYCFGTAAARVALAQGQCALLCFALPRRCFGAGTVRSGMLRDALSRSVRTPRRAGAGDIALWYAMLSVALLPVVLPLARWLCLQVLHAERQPHTHKVNQTELRYGLHRPAPLLT